MIRALTLCLALYAPFAVLAQDFAVEGKYELVDPPQPTETPGKVEVVDVFWYGCPHCYRFLPVMERFESDMPEYVELRRMPAVFRKSWEVHAQAFYTAEVLGRVSELHRPIFDAIHAGNRKLSTEEELAEFFEKHGVPREDFEQTFDSFAVQSNVRKSVIMQERYGVRGTPTVIVNGKYRVSGRLAGNYENMLKVIRVLVDREHEAASAAN